MKSKNTVIGNKIGLNVNIMINGNSQQKTFENNDEALKFYKLLLDVAQDPTDEKVEVLLENINKTYRITKHGFLEYEPKTNKWYMGKTNIPMPEMIVETIEEYLSSGLPVEYLKKFWNLLLLNPYEHVRQDLFRFLRTYNFVITPNGYFVAYKAVKHKQIKENDLATFVSNQYLKVIKDWKSSASRYEVYKDVEGVFYITKKSTFEKWDIKEKNVEHIGNLKDLHNKLDELSADATATLFTDKHTGQMDIRLGTPVLMKRSECNGDPTVECSYGLHVGSVKYVEAFGDNSDDYLLCLVNPMNVIAVPRYDNSKMRVCEYFPLAVLNKINEPDQCKLKFETIDTPFLESDYLNYDNESIELLIEELKVKEEREELKEDESEILRLLENRVVEF